MSNGQEHELNAPAFLGRYWHALWVYFLAPSRMLVAAELFLSMRHGVGPYCAKLHHANDKRCIFCQSTEQKVVRVCSMETEFLSGRRETHLSVVVEPTEIRHWRKAVRKLSGLVRDLPASFRTNSNRQNDFHSTSPSKKGLWLWHRSCARGHRNEETIQ